MTDVESQRERAYRIWEEEGRPEGRELEHWRMAEKKPGGAEQQASETTKANQNASDEFNGEKSQDKSPADTHPPSTVSPD